jgi:hypothetical protein
MSSRRPGPRDPPLRAENDLDGSGLSKLAGEVAISSDPRRIGRRPFTSSSVT